MVHCAAIDCGSTSDCFKDGEPISFFKLPNDKYRKNLWIANLKRDDLPKSNVYVCHLHFEDFYIKIEMMNDLMGNKTRKILTKDAVPTVFSNKQQSNNINAIIQWMPVIQLGVVDSMPLGSSGVMSSSGQTPTVIDLDSDSDDMEIIECSSKDKPSAGTGPSESLPMEVDKEKSYPDLEIISEEGVPKKTVFVSSTWTPKDVENFMSKRKARASPEETTPKCKVCLKESKFDEETIYWETMLFCNTDCFGNYDDLLNSSRSFKRTFGLLSVGHFCLENRAELDKHNKSYEEKCYEIMNDTYFGSCGTCLNDRKVSYELQMQDSSSSNGSSNKNKIVQFCSEDCFDVFKRIHSMSTNICKFCCVYYDTSSSNQVIYSHAVSKSFCSRLCLAVYFIRYRKMVNCHRCQNSRHNFNMIEKASPGGASLYYCSSACLKGNKDDDAQTSSSLPVIESVSSLTTDSLVALEASPPKPVLREPPMVKLEEPAVSKNKSISAMPIYKDQEVPCMIHDTSEGSTQTDPLEIPPSHPLTVPFVLPVPMRMLSNPYPVPIPFPLYVPVPVFIPVKESSLEEIYAKIKDSLGDDALLVKDLMPIKESIIGAEEYEKFFAGEESPEAAPPSPGSLDPLMAAEEDLDIAESNECDLNAVESNELDLNAAESNEDDLDAAESNEDDLESNEDELKPVEESKEDGIEAGEEPKEDSPDTTTNLEAENPMECSLSISDSSITQL